jgi:hypothetical protein
MPGFGGAHDVMFFANKSDRRTRGNYLVIQIWWENLSFDSDKLFMPCGFRRSIP